MAAFDSSKIKAPRKFRFLRKCGRLIMVPVICLASVPAYAQTWNGAVDDNWSTGGNWIGGVAPGLLGVNGDTATFGGLGPTEIDVDVPVTLSHLEFNGAVTYNVNGGGNQITLDDTGFGGMESIDITAGTVTIGADLVLVNGVDVNAAVDATIAGVISGVGDLTKEGVGALLISGANTYNGPTNVNAGTLRLGAADVITDTSTVDVTGTLDLNGFSETIGSLSGTGTVELTDQVLTLGGDNSNKTFGGDLNGTGSIVKDGTGTFTVGTANTFSGGTTINGGVIAIPNQNALGTGTVTFDGGGLELAGALNVANDMNFAGAGTIDANGGADTLSGDFMGTGDLMKTGVATLTLSGDLTGYTGNVMIDAGDLEIDTGTASTTLSGNVTGPGGLIKSGANELALGGTNTFSGGLDINGGTVVVGSADALGDPASSITFNDGALRTTAGITSAHTINIGLGDATIVTGGFDSSYSGAVNDIGAGGNLMISGGGTQTFSGDLLGFTGNINATGGVLEIDTSIGSTSIVGDITGGAGLLKTGSNTLTLSGTNDYSGGTEIQMGTISIGAANNIGTGTITFNGGTLQTTMPITLVPGVDNNLAFNAGGGTIDTAGNDALFSGNLSGAGNFTKEGGGTLTFSGAITPFTGNVAIDGGVLDFDVGGTEVLSGNVTGTGDFMKSGGGILSLSGNNDAHVGSTIITAGRLRSLASGTIGDISNVFISGGATLDINDFDETIGGLFGDVGSSVVLNGATLTTSNDAGVNDSTFNGVISGNMDSAVVKAGDGVLTLGGGNTFEGTFTIQEGSVRLDPVAVGPDGVLANRMAMNIFTDAIFELNGNDETIGPLSGNGDVHQGLLGAPGGGTLTVNSEDANGAAADSTFTGRVIGTGGLTKVGGGILTLGGSNTYTGVTTINAGTLQLASDDRINDASALVIDQTTATSAIFDLNNSNERVGSLEGNGFVLLGTGTLNAGNADMAADMRTYAGIISGTGGFTKEGAGTLTLTGMNTYTGTTRVSDTGTLQLGVGGAIADDSAVLVDANATFDLNDFDETVASLSGAGTVDLGTGTLTTGGDDSSTTFSGIITSDPFPPGGGLTKEGMGTFTLSGLNTYTGATTVNAGTLRADSTMAFGDNSAVTVAMDATLDLNDNNNTIGSLAGVGSVTLGNAILTTGGNDQDTEFSGIISGTGGLVKEGMSTFTLSGMNTYAGGTTLNDGVLLVGMDENLGASGPGIGELTFNGGTLGLSADLTTARDVIINAGGGTIDTNGFNGTLSGIVSGAGAITKIDDGTLTLTGTNTYAGGTNINGGTVSVGSDLNLGDAAGPVTFMNGGILQTSAGITSDRALTFNLPGGGTIDTQTFDSSFSGAVTGAGNMTKDGTGTLTLSGGLGGYTGDTTIAAGTLEVDTTAGSTTHVGAITGPGNLTKSGSNTLTLAGSLNAFTGNTAIDMGILEIDTAAGDTTYSGIISGIGGLQKSGANTLLLTGMSTYTGPTAIDAGMLQFGANDVLSDQTAVTVAGGAVLDIDTFTDTIGSLAGAGNVMLGTGTLSAGADNTSTTFSGIFSESGQFIKVGTGTMTLTGANTHTGGTAINGGILSISNDVNLGDPASVLSFDGGTLLTTAGINTLRLVTINAGGGTIDTNGFNSTFSGVMSGVGGLTKQGAGILTLTGLNTYQGGTAINGGTLSIGDDANLGDAAGPVTFMNGGILQTSAGITSDRALTFNLPGGGTIDTNGFNSSFSGPVTGFGDLTKNGAGNLRLSGGLNGYTGDTTVNAGTLEVNTDGGDTAHAGSLSGAGDLVKSGNNTLTLAGSLNGFTGDVAIAGGILDVDTTVGSTALVGDISGVGGLSKSGPNTLTLSGMNTYSGPTAINAGMLTLGSGTAIGDQSAVTVAAGATLNQNGFSETIGSLAGAGDVTLGAGTLTTGGNNDTTEFTGIISGNGGLVKEGTGVFTLSGINTYLGGTTINGGTVSISDNLNLGNAAGPLTFGGGTLLTTADVTSGRAVTLNAAGGTIDTGMFDSTFSGIFFGPGALTKEGTGTLTLTGVNTYAGGTNINDGILSVSHDNNMGAAAGPLNFDGGTLLTTAGIMSARDGVINAGGAIFDTNGFDSIMAGDFAGAGGLTKNGLGTLSLDGTNTYVGPTTINGGRLDVNGSITSDTTANTGTTLGGNGTITGDVFIADGATMAPGNSIGLTNIVGNYTQASGSIFELEIQPAPRGAEVAGVDFDQTNVVGSAVINPGATVNVVSAPGTYELGNRFRFLQTTGGVTGTYDPLAGVTFNGGRLVGTLFHNANSVDLVINGTNFSGVGTINTKNLRAAATGLDQLSLIASAAPTSDAANVINQLLVLPGPQLANAVNQIGGASHGSNQVVALQSSFDYLRSVRNRVRTDLVNIDDGRQNPIWVEGMGTFGEIDPDGNAAGVEYDGAGFIVGFDQSMAGGRQGISIGVNQVDTESGLATGTIDSYNITAYTSTLADPVYIMGAVGYGRNEFDSTRTISALNPNRVANGSTSGNQLLGLLEYGLFANTDRWESQVFVSGQYAGLRQDGFIETGAGAVNLNVRDSSTNSFRTIIGMRMAGKLSNRVEPEFHAGFIHEFLDADSMTISSFNGTNVSFQQCGVALPENMGQVGFGSTLLLENNCSIYVGYDALISGSQLSQTVNGTLILNY